jgi:hypothetical protein
MELIAVGYSVSIEKVACSIYYRIMILSLIVVCFFLQAVLVVAARSVVVTWVCRKKGPVFVSLFSPLGIVIAVAMGIPFLGETLYLGRYINFSNLNVLIL